MIEKRKKIILIFLGFLFIADILAWNIVFDLSRTRFLEVNFFDVGQGDAILIESPKRTQILIDGGPSSKILEKLSETLPFYDRSIDLIILTHPDPDHLLGLIDVLKRYKVDLIGTNGAVSSRPEFKEFMSQILKKEVPLKILKKDQRISIGESLSFDILAPLENFDGRKVSDYNTSSIVSKMIYGDSSFLFTGDTTQSVEKELVKQGINLNSDILKIGHHGSKTSTTEDFLKKITPEIAVIQVGKNNQYGHPYSEVLERLEKFGIKIFRTDENGDIKIISDGVSFGRAVSGSTPSAKAKEQ